VSGWDADVKQVFKELVEGVIRVTYDEHFLGSVFYQGLSEERTDERLARSRGSLNETD
jgi:hypothetical protein